MTKYPPMIICDFYKFGHAHQTPPNSEEIYETWTARDSRLKGVDHVVAFGFQGFIKEWLIDYFTENFFNKPVDEVVAEYERYVKFCLNATPNSTHIKNLHGLGYLPIEICAVEEGTLVPIRCPMLTIRNTHPYGYFFVGFLETLFSCEVWQPITTATTAYEYKKILNKYADLTCDDRNHVQFQAHDFSMRGMGGVAAAAKSGIGHLLSFTGSDNVPAIYNAERYYNANVEKELVGCSIPASEHSIMEALGQDEKAAFKYLLTEIYPNGLASIVADTWDLWKVITEVIADLKPEIMARDGKAVIRPDSGDPVDIICGTNAKVQTIEAETYEDFIKLAEDILDTELREITPHGEHGGDLSMKFKWDGDTYKVTYAPDWNRHDKQYYYIDNYGGDKTTAVKVEVTPADKGVVELLWDIFGGTVNDKGYKVLDSHIGAIYGDSITLERAKDICEGLMAKGFASSNIVLGVGSYTYQYVTRDTFGMALKATYGVFGGEEKLLFKDPITDCGIKKSQKGMVMVGPHPNGGLQWQDGLYKEHKELGKDVDLLKPIYRDGKLIVDSSLADIRRKLECPQ